MNSYHLFSQVATRKTVESSSAVKDSMVRFSCFYGHSHKPKRMFQSPLEAMHQALEDCPRKQVSKEHYNPASLLNQLPMKVCGDALLNNNDMLAAESSSVECSWKSEEINGKAICDVESNIELQQGHLTKSRSLGSMLGRDGQVSGSNNNGVEIDRGHSCDDDACDLHGSTMLSRHNDLEISSVNHIQEADVPLKSPQVSFGMVNESIFSIGDPRNLEKEDAENFDTHLSSDGNGDSGETRNLPSIVKSCSMPNIGADLRVLGASVGRRCRSSEDLHVLKIRQNENLLHHVGPQDQDQERDYVTSKADKNLDTIIEDGFESYHCVGSAKDWIIPVMDEGDVGKLSEGKSLEYLQSQSLGGDIKIKRIKEWVMDLQHFSPLEETTESLHVSDQLNKAFDPVDGLTATKFDSKVTPTMEAAKKYISSLSASTTTVQLANHGLVVIPFLSAFVSLKVLNLSGNAIVRITAGALPRGLHMLNLSKNSISTIEGLRELTRLRVLDLSYNRILRIGHGLASCSPLKELYLAGNKISEVEGLHRLLKLSVLDLRFNKISTAKCLGQLAANYNSIQAISLEGNPAQKNVGDEPLKKQLQGLLPHLAYYNRQPIKAGALKDTADRSTRLGTSHQFDRSSTRLEHRLRKGTHVIAAGQKPSSSMNYGRKSQAVVGSPKQARGSNRHARLPPIVAKPVTHQQHLDFSSKLGGLRPDQSMRRSRSEGTLGAI